MFPLICECHATHAGLHPARDERTSERTKPKPIVYAHKKHTHKTAHQKGVNLDLIRSVECVECVCAHDVRRDRNCLLLSHDLGVIERVGPQLHT